MRGLHVNRCVATGRNLYREKYPHTPLSVGFEHVHPEGLFIAENLMRNDLLPDVDELEVIGQRVVKIEVDGRFGHLISLPAKWVEDHDRQSLCTGVIDLPRKQAQMI